MTQSKRQEFVAYRSISDEFEIRFYGGPLDGARIKTDVFPDSEEFVHVFQQRQYYYRYTQVDAGHFKAQLSGFEPTRNRRPAKTRWRTLCVLLLLFACTAALAIAGFYSDILSR